MTHLDIHQQMHEQLPFIRESLQGQYVGWIIAILSVWLFVLLQLSDGALAAKANKRSLYDIPTGQNAMRAEEEADRDTHRISGELIGADGDYYVILLLSLCSSKFAVRQEDR